MDNHTHTPKEHIQDNIFKCECGVKMEITGPRHIELRETFSIIYILK